MKWWERFLCWMDWHKSRVLGFDGCSSIGKCELCGEKLLMDSQGNWFGIERHMQA